MKDTTEKIKEKQIIFYWKFVKNKSKTMIMMVIKCFVQIQYRQNNHYFLIIILRMLANSKPTNQSLSQRTKSSRQVLRQLINEQPAHPKFQNIQSKDFDIQKLRLSEAITFLQKKVDKHKNEIKQLKQAKQTNQTQKKLLTKQLQNEKNINTRLQQRCEGHIKNNTQLKKKMNKLQKEVIQAAQKNQQLQNKVRRLRDLLRRKQDQVHKLQSKVHNNTPVQKQKMSETNTKQQFQSMRMSFSNLKEKEHTLQSKLQIKSKLLQKVQQKLHEKEQQCFMLEQKNKRLEQQLKQTQLLYEEEKLEIIKMSEQIKQVFEEKDNQLATLRAKTQRMQQQSNEECKKKQPHIFMKEISSILKDNIYDKRKRQQIEKLIKAVVDQMQQSWNRIIKSAILQH